MVHKSIIWEGITTVYHYGSTLSMPAEAPYSSQLTNRQFHSQLTAPNKNEK